MSCIDVHPTVFSMTPSVAKVDHGQKRDDDPLGYSDVRLRSATNEYRSDLKSDKYSRL